MTDRLSPSFLIAASKARHEGEKALWIYEAGNGIQCFECGWFEKAENLEIAKQLFVRHECKPDIND